MTRQLDIGDLSTSQVVAKAYQRQAKAKGGKRQSARSQAEEEFARQCRLHRLPQYRQHFVMPAFHRTPKLQRQATWEFDGLFPDFNLLVEIQGGVWMRGKGAHSHPVDLVRNFRKHNDATRQGYAILQFEPDYVISGAAISYTMHVLAERYGWTRVQGQ
jgi:hypothetical protein